jgi:hypothetical protein
MGSMIRRVLLLNIRVDLTMRMSSSRESPPTSGSSNGSWRYLLASYALRTINHPRHHELTTPFRRWRQVDAASNL